MAIMFFLQLPETIPFKDNDYWRGRIWAPMNFLVYLGMQKYNLTDARTDLVNKSRNLLLKNWRENAGIYENYNSVTGKGNDVIMQMVTITGVHCFHLWNL